MGRSFCPVPVSPEDVPNSPLPHRQSSLPASTDGIRVDPDCLLPQDVRNRFHMIHREYHAVFSTSPMGYNGAVGPFKAVVNMGLVSPPPPQRKGRLPQYNKDKLSALQDKFDCLESAGLFRRPEDVDITVEYVNPSFLSW